MEEQEYWQKIKHLLDLAESNLMQARELLNEKSCREQTGDLINGDDKTIEGIFTGEEMITGEGKKYPVPANYASKSQLVVGDILKLTIIADGSFVYKQIKPVTRKKIIGVLDEVQGEYLVNANGKNYRLLKAAVSYHHGGKGDKITALIPHAGEANWAAVENIIKKGAAQ